MISSTHPRSRFIGSLLLSAIGDSLGWITEFERSKDSLYRKYDVEEITGFLEWEKKVGGRFVSYTDRIKPGDYSDDTQLMLSVARCIQSQNHIDHTYFAKVELPNWLLYQRGGGRTIKVAARKIIRKKIEWNTNFFNFKVNDSIVRSIDSGANGAAMRVLPIALAFSADLEKLKTHIFSNSIITHGHPTAIIGALLYGYAIKIILSINSLTFKPETFITEIGKALPFQLMLDFGKNSQLEQWIKLWEAESKTYFTELFRKQMDQALQHLRYIYKQVVAKSNTANVFEYLGCFNRETKGSGIATVLASIFLVGRYWNDPEKAMLEAVNAINADTDSIAAFTGGMLGALFGDNIIPDKWKTVQDYEYLVTVAEHLYKIAHKRESNLLPPKSSKNTKPITDKMEDHFVINDIVSFEPLGEGKVTGIERQDALNKSKYNLIMQVLFKNGQSCVFSKLLNKPSN